MVLPCVPATATPRNPAITAASASARDTTGIPRSWAPTTSGLVALIAVETTTTSAPSTLAASWPTRASTPRARSATSRRESLASLPETTAPRATRMRAMPDMPGTADADDVHAPGQVRPSGSPRPATGWSAGCVEHHVGELLVGVADAVGGGPRHPSARSARDRPPAARTSASRVSPSRSSSSTSSPPPASTTGRALSRCSPLPIGSGHVDRRQARRRRARRRSSRRCG